MFTSEEARAVRPALEGAITYTRALEGLGYALDRLSTLTRPTYLTACGQMARAARDVGAGALALIGCLPEHLAGRGMRRGETLADVVPEAPRSAQLECAWAGPPNGITRATESTLEDAAAAVRPISGDLAEMIRQTRAALLSVNRAALLHSDPPPGLTFGGRRTTIGPHADFYRSQHYLLTATHYMHGWAEEGFVPVLEAAELKVRAALADCWRLYALISRVAIQAAALNCGIPLYSGWENLPIIQESRQFALTLEAIWLKTRAVEMHDGEGLPELFAALGARWVAVRPGLRLARMGAWDRGLIQRDDAWRRADNSAGNDSHFPDRRAG